MALVQSNVYPSKRASESKDYWDQCKERVTARSVEQKAIVRKAKDPETDYQRCMRLAREAWAVGAHKEAQKLRRMANILRDGVRARVVFASSGGGRCGSMG